MQAYKVQDHKSDQEELIMKTFTCNTFNGHYPVGTAAIVTAKSAKDAAKKLEAVLVEHGLPQQIVPAMMKPFATGVRILCDGNY